MEFNRFLTAPGTFKDMCALIEEAQILEVDGKFATAQQIFNYSPTGELYRIQEWYLMALTVLGKVTQEEIDRFLAQSLFKDFTSNG
ncbi:hypothetical protein [Adhaeribacter arboris]|nr:hypothetical protein [Adhaeribacter arboris]